jgi:hypothetical protein
METIQIHDSDERGFLAPDLRTMLEVIDRFGRDLRWVIAWLDATPEPSFVWEYVNVERIATSSEPLRIVSWDELTRLSRAILFAEDALLVGYSSETEIGSQWGG